MIMRKLPAYISEYLWDVPKDKLSVSKNADFIIERVLEYGGTKALGWINENYDKEKIIKVLKNSKKISSKTGNFYALYYDIPKESLQCIKKPFTRKQDRF